MYFKVVTGDGRHCWWFETSTAARQSCDLTHSVPLRYALTEDDTVHVFDEQSNELIYVMSRQIQSPIHNMPIRLE